jgi:hypothetical protein
MKLYIEKSLITRFEVAIVSKSPAGKKKKGSKKKTK